MALASATSTPTRAISSSAINPTKLPPRKFSRASLPLIRTAQTSAFPRFRSKSCLPGWAGRPRSAPSSSPVIAAVVRSDSLRARKQPLAKPVKPLRPPPSLPPRRPIRSARRPPQRRLRPPLTPSLLPRRLLLLPRIRLHQNKRCGTQLLKQCHCWIVQQGRTKEGLSLRPDCKKRDPSLHLSSLRLRVSVLSCCALDLKPPSSLRGKLFQRFRADSARLVHSRPSPTPCPPLSKPTTSLRPTSRVYCAASASPRSKASPFASNGVKSLGFSAATVRARPPSSRRCSESSANRPAKPACLIFRPATAVAAGSSAISPKTSAFLGISPATRLSNTTAI